MIVTDVSESGGIMNYQEAYKKLEKYGQLHVLKYYEELYFV